MIHQFSGNPAKDKLRNELNDALLETLALIDEFRAYMVANYHRAPESEGMAMLEEKVRRIRELMDDD